MADHVIETRLEPDAKATTPRKSGDPMTPEGAKARLSPGGRKGAISGAPLVPEGTSARKSGKAMDNAQKSKFVARVINGPMNDEPHISGIPK